MMPIKRVSQCFTTWQPEKSTMERVMKKESSKKETQLLSMLILKTKTWLSMSMENWLDRNKPQSILEAMKPTHSFNYKRKTQSSASEDHEWSFKYHISFKNAFLSNKWNHDSKSNIWYRWIFQYNHFRLNTKNNKYGKNEFSCLKLTNSSIFFIFILFDSFIGDLSGHITHINLISRVF